MNLALAVAVVSLAMSSSGQDARLRYELFARLRDCELQLMQHPNAWVKAGAVERVQAAAAKCFDSDLSMACRELCAAAAQTRVVLERPEREPDNLMFDAQPHLIDAADSGLVVRWRQMGSPADGRGWIATLDLADGQSYHVDFLSSHATEYSWEPPVSFGAEGDVRANCTVFDGDFAGLMRSIVLSVVEHRDERLTALKAAIEAARGKAAGLELATAEMLRGLLTSLASGSTEAHEYPGARLLAEAEQVVAAAAKGERWYGPERNGEFWLALPVGAAGVRTRVLVPSGLAKDKPAPLVLALHGRSFDEDTWFDGYGCGQSVELCRKRGWMLAAPHCDGDEDAAKLEGIVKALADVYPIDMKRVMLLGHSRGGGSALAALAQAPNHFRAVATIGSALAPERVSELTKRPLFLAAGDRDFARESVEALHKAFSAANATNATFKLYPHVEHWLCVTVALPDVFAWFDAQQK